MLRGHWRQAEEGEYPTDASEGKNGVHRSRYSEQDASHFTDGMKEHPAWSSGLMEEDKKQL